jgi:hypothetical protein
LLLVLVLVLPRLLFFFFHSCSAFLLFPVLSLPSGLLSFFVWIL